MTDLFLLLAAQAADSSAELGKVAAWAAAGAAVIRVIMAILRSKAIAGLLVRLVPAFAKPAIPILKVAIPVVLACALAGLEALASGRPLLEALVVGLGAWGGAELTYRAQKQAPKVREIRRGGSIQLDGAGMSGPRP